MAKARKTNPAASSANNSTPQTENVSEVQVVPTVVAPVSTPVVETVVATPVFVPEVSQPASLAVEPVVESVAVVQESASNVVSGGKYDNSSFQLKYEAILGRVKQSQSLLREINSDLILLNREYQRTSRPVQKKKLFKKNDNSRSGITQEVGVSKELESFLGLTPGSKISRTAVTRAVTEYIKTHNLQNPENRRHIILDSTLSKLLNPGSNEDVTYFNLQKYLKVHYTGSAANLAAVSSA